MATDGPLNDFNLDRAPSVWLCHTSAGSAAPERLTWLTAEEQQRVGRLSGVARAEFLASRWLIRRALSEASGHDVQACCPAPGRTVASQSPPGWRLSLSHSHGLVGCALSSSGAVGLDLEPLVRKTQWQAIVRRWFSEPERDWLLARNDHREFLKVWTLKEAWLKATGRGIANNLQTLTVHEDFTLGGDQPNVPWRAAMGEMDGFLVTLVDQRPAHNVTCVPECRRVTGPVDWQKLSSGVVDTVTHMEWLLNRPIH